MWLIHHINGIKHALRVLPVIAAVAKVSCKHGLWLVARVNLKQASGLFSSGSLFLYTYMNFIPLRPHLHPQAGSPGWHALQ